MKDRAQHGIDQQHRQKLRASYCAAKPGSPSTGFEIVGATRLRIEFDFKSAG